MAKKFEKLILEEYGPQELARHINPPKPISKQNKYTKAYQIAARMKNTDLVKKTIRRIGGERFQIPLKPAQFVTPSRPRYRHQSQRASKSSINRVLHKYPELLPLFFLPNRMYTPIKTPFLENQHMPGYTFFPPYRTRSSSGSRSNNSFNNDSGGGGGNTHTRRIQPMQPPYTHRPRSPTRRPRSPTRRSRSRN